jgi:F420 biosynthesis protein FbiB-like protein
VPEPVIERILTTATYAPSAHNRQPWRFVVLSGADTKNRLADAMAEDFRRDLTQDGMTPVEVENQITRSRDRMQAAPLVIVLCMDTTGMDSYPDARRRRAEYTMAQQSAAAAGLQLLLAAHAEGLGGVWVCSPLFAPATVVRVLRLDSNWEPQAMFYIGQSAGSPPVREKAPAQSVSIRR